MVEAVLGLGVDPESANSVDIGIHVDARRADSAPSNTLTVNQTISDVHGIVVIASAGISTLILVNNTVDQSLSISSNSVSLLGVIDQNVVRRSGRGDEFKEKVRPSRVDLVDSSQRSNHVLVGDPDKPAESDFFSLDDHEEVKSGSTELGIQILLDVLGIGSNIILIEGAGGVGIVDECGNLLLPDSSTSEVIELQCASGGGEFNLLGLLDGNSEDSCCDGQKKEGGLHFKICRIIITKLFKS